jgi:alkylhydroperoxidase/carboxymuconolactone decarboxylase family protein YurZ
MDRRRILMNDKLPPLLQVVVEKYPDVWDAYSRLGEACGEAGPLDERTLRLVKLGIAVGAQLQGAVHSHARRARKLGLSEAELEQVALLAVTTLGWPAAMAALSWIQDVLHSEAEAAG